MLQVQAWFVHVLVQQGLALMEMREKGEHRAGSVMEEDLGTFLHDCNP